MEGLGEGEMGSSSLSIRTWIWRESSSSIDGLAMAVLEIGEAFVRPVLFWTSCREVDVKIGESVEVDGEDKTIRDRLRASRPSYLSDRFCICRRHVRRSAYELGR